MKVLLIHHGAAYASSQAIYRALGAIEGVQLRVLAPRRGYNRLRRRVVELSGIKTATHEIVTGHVYRCMRDMSGPYVRGMAREFVGFRPDVIHVLNEPYAMVNVQALLLRRLLCPRARCYSLAFENILPSATSARNAARRRYVQTQTDGVACCSDGAIDALVGSGFPDARLFPSHWGVPLEAFRSAATRKVPPITPGSDFLIGYIGRIEIEKGLWTILHAMRRLPPRFRCVCIGDGSAMEWFRAQVDQFGLSDRVSMPGRVPEADVPTHLASMHALVLPSESTLHWKEQFGRVLVEAQAAGVPSVAADSGAITEVVGDAGLIFPERDFVAMAEHVQSLADDRVLYAELVENGRRRSASLYSCEAFSQRLMTLYRQTK